MLEQRAVLRAAAEAVDERLGDLEHVDRQRAQVAAATSSRCRSRRARSARRARAARSSTALARVGVVASSTLSVSSSTSRRGSSPASASALATSPHELGVAQLGGGDVDVHAQRRREPSRASQRAAAAGLRRGRAADRATISPVSSASGMKSPAASSPRRRVLPARERLDGDDLAASRARRSAGSGATISPALDARCELVARASCAAQQRARRIAGVEDREPRPCPPPWRGTWRRRRCAAARRRRARRLARAAMPMLGADPQLAAVERERRLEAPRAMRSAIASRVVEVVDVLEQDRELVAAEPRRRGRSARTQARMPLGERDQQLVAAPRGRARR